MCSTLLVTDEGGERGDERGFVVVWLAIVLALLLSVAALAVDLVHAYAQAQRLQNAVDAAALAGATQIPADLRGDAAKRRVLEILEENGYDTATDPDIQVVTNDIDSHNPNQMNVELRYRFETFFGNIMGFSNLTVRRTANGQYDAKVAMGSPANNLGDVPSGGAAGDSCVDLGFSVTPGVSSCASINDNATQDLWLSVQGKDTAKYSGNAYSTETCPSATSGIYIDPADLNGADGCDGSASSGGANKEYDPNGLHFTVRNDVPGQKLVIAVYDAGFVATGGSCAYPIGGTDTNRHTANSPYCAGDKTQSGTVCNFASGSPFLAHCGKNMNTQFSVLGPDATPGDLSNNPEVACERGGAPWDIPGEAPNLGETPIKLATVNDGSGNPTDAVPGNTTLDFMQHWKVLCTIATSSDPNPAAQEYYVRVKSPNGQGTNNFSIVALHNLGDPPTDGLTVSTRERLPLFAKRTTATAGDPADFYVANIRPAARDRQLIIELFDFGDSGLVGSTGSLELIPYNASVPAQGDKFSCSYTSPPGSGPEGGAWDEEAPWDDPSDELSKSWTGQGCKIDFDMKSWNGQWITIKVTIPGTASGGYTCPTGVGATTNDCWIKMRIVLASGELSDATTWNARLSGAPVRLVK